MAAPELVQRDPAALARRVPATLAHASGLISSRQFLFSGSGEPAERATTAGVRSSAICPSSSPSTAPTSGPTRSLFQLDAERPSDAGGRCAARLLQRHRPAVGQSALRLGGDGERLRLVDRPLQAALEQVDVVRLDHFRGFAALLGGPGREPTAVKALGHRPRRRFFDAVRGRLGGLPLIAEDLGVITPGWRRCATIRPARHARSCSSPSATSRTVPAAQLVPARVVYTGTHDNDTTVGWFAVPPERAGLRASLPAPSRTSAGTCIRRGLASVADVAIYPLQDVLGLGSEGRMNLRAGPRQLGLARGLEPAQAGSHRAPQGDLAEPTGRCDRRILIAQRDRLREPFPNERTGHPARVHGPPGPSIRRNGDEASRKTRSPARGSPAEPRRAARDRLASRRTRIARS